MPDRLFARFVTIMVAWLNVGVLLVIAGLLLQADGLLWRILWMTVLWLPLFLIAAVFAKWSWDTIDEDFR